MRLRAFVIGALVALPQPGAWSQTGSSDPASNFTQEPTFWLIPHTHWEGAVFKTREEYLDQGLPNILAALRLLKEYPDYRFVLDQVAYFRPFLRRYPEEAGAFRRFVAEGRLQIVGGTDIMPDDNMPGGESFVRQVLYAKGFCRDELGVDVKVGWFLDTFGHHAQLPQLLKLSGYNSFWFVRGVPARDHMPSEFLWQGLDGTRIPAFWLPLGYSLLHNSPSDLVPFIAFVKNRYRALARFSSDGDRVGLAGSDISEPEPRVPALAGLFDRQTNLPFRLRIGLPTDFEAAVGRRADLPVISGDLNPIFQGAYSSRIELKQLMRSTELQLTTAESVGALANWLDAPTDGDPTWRAWEPVLFNMAHDLAAGVMTERVYEDTLRSYEFSRRLAEELIRNRLARILAHIDTRGPGIPLAVFNTLGWPRADIAQGEVGFTQGGVTDIDIVDPFGNTVPVQIIEAGRYADGGLQRVKFAFVAREVPAVGFAIYRIVPRPKAGVPRSSVLDSSGSNALENDFYEAKFDLATGALTNLLVKTGSWQALSGPANVVAREPDDGDVWELYRNVDAAQKIVTTRPLGLPNPKHALLSTKQSGRIGMMRRGPVFSEFHVRHPLGTNSFATTVRVYAGIPRIDFKTQIRNYDRFVRYRLLVPTAIKNGTNFHEIPFGAIERPCAQEFPAQNWIDYTDGHRGVALLNRGLPGNNVADGTLMLSLLRSTRLQSHTAGGYQPPSNESGLELGKERSFEYALVPHSGDWREAAIYRAGLEFNHPLIVRKIASHPGTLPGQWGLLEASAPNIVLSALKPGTAGAVILRVYEAAGKAAPGAEIRLQARIASAHEANLMEDELAKIEIRNDTLRFDLHPFEIKTFKLRLEPFQPEPRTSK